MASKLFRRVVKVYQEKQFFKFITSRNFSSYDERVPPTQTVFIEIIGKDTNFRWPETKLGLLEPMDARFPLPGIVGSQVPLDPVLPSSDPVKNFSLEIHKEKQKNYSTNEIIDLILMGQNNYQQQIAIVDEFLKSYEKSDIKEKIEDCPFKIFDFKSQECPYFLKKDFQIFFPNFNILHQRISVISFYFKNGIELTRKEINKKFTEAATDMCETLHSVGFWADFLDPFSGRPFLTISLNSTLLYETDALYRRFAFHIQSYGMCKLSNHQFKIDSCNFVGCILTTAPLNHPLLQLNNLYNE